MNYLVYLGYLTNPILLMGNIFGSIYIYISRLFGYTVEKLSINYIMATRKTESNMNTSLSKSNSMVKTTSINNLSSMINDNFITHFKFSNKIHTLSKINPEYIYIKEVIKNAEYPLKRCSNPKCRIKLNINKCIYNAFDVQFCSDKCRTITSKHVAHYWI